MNIATDAGAVEALIATLPDVSSVQLEWLALSHGMTSRDVDHAEAKATALRVAGEAVPSRLMAYDRAHRDSGLAAIQAGWGSQSLRDLAEASVGQPPVDAAIEALCWAAAALTIDDIAPDAADVLSRAWVIGLQLGSWAQSARLGEVTFALDRMREGWAGSAQNLTALARQQTALGDQGPWVTHLPLAWRLAAGAVDGPPPQLEVAVDEGPAEGCAYWNPMLHLLRYRLGWSNPARGVAMWWSAGLPVDDPTLRLLHDWYGHHLPLGIEWLHRDDSPPTGVAQAAAAVRASGRQLLDPSSGGWDAYHLSVHDGAPMEEPADPVDGCRIIRDASETVLISPTYTGWYSALLDEGDPARDPQADGTVGQVDVVVESIGWLGTYRWSPTSRRFHASDEVTHLWGVTPVAEPTFTAEVVEDRARGLMLGLLLGDAAGEWTGEEPLRGTCLAQLACYTLEGLIRASVRSDHHGICHPPSVVWHAWCRWAHRQGLGPAFREAWADSPRWPDGWLSQVGPLADRRGNAPATCHALLTGAQVPDRARGVSEGHHGLTRALPVAIMTSLHDATSVARDLAAFSHGPDAAAAAAEGVALATELLRQGPTAWATAPVSFDRPTEAKVGTAQHALHFGALAARSANGLHNAVDIARPHGPGAVTTAAALFGATHGMSAMPSDLLVRLDIGWVADQLARDACLQQLRHPGGGEYAPADDPNWRVKYPGW